MSNSSDTVRDLGMNQSSYMSSHTVHTLQRAVFPSLPSPIQVHFLPMLLIHSRNQTCAPSTHLLPDSLVHVDRSYPRVQNHKLHLRDKQVHQVLEVYFSVHSYLPMDPLSSASISGRGRGITGNMILHSNAMVCFAMLYVS